MSNLPTPLVRFGGELEAAIRRERDASRRRRRAVATRAAVAASAAAAVAAVLLTLPGGPDGGLVGEASAAQRAAAALTAASGPVVHVDMLVTQRDADGSLHTWRQQSWQRTTPPYDRREIVTPQGGEPQETATIDGDREVYDAQADTVYITPSGSPSPAAGATPEPASPEPFRDQILALLRSGKLTPSGRTTLDGRPAVAFGWDDGNTRYDYTVDASSATTVDFTAYESLAAGRPALDLTAQHPDATVHRTP